MAESSDAGEIKAIGAGVANQLIGTMDCAVNLLPEFRAAALSQFTSVAKGYVAKDMTYALKEFRFAKTEHKAAEDRRLERQRKAAEAAEENRVDGSTSNDS